MPAMPGKAHRRAIEGACRWPARILCRDHSKTIPVSATTARRWSRLRTRNPSPSAQDRGPGMPRVPPAYPSARDSEQRRVHRLPYGDIWPLQTVQRSRDGCSVRRPLPPPAPHTRRQQLGRRLYSERCRSSPPSSRRSTWNVKRRRPTGSPRDRETETEETKSLPCLPTPDSPLPSSHCSVIVDRRSPPAVPQCVASFSSELIPA